MAKGTGRKAEKASAQARSTAGATAGVATLSPEEADRAAAAFVPLWQFDEAPFEVAPKSTADLVALGSATPLELAPAPTLAAAVKPLDARPTIVSSPFGASEAANLAVAPAAAPASVPPAGIAPAVAPDGIAPAVAPDGIAPPVAEEASDGAPADDAGLLSRATIRMAPLVTLHQPAPHRPADPDLPSVMVDEPEPVPPPVVSGRTEPPVVATANVASAPVRTVTAPMPAFVGFPASAAVPAPALREPKTDPPLSRARPAPRAAVAEVEGPTSVYKIPRSRVPVVVGSAVVAGLLTIVGIYVMTGAPSSSATTPSTGTAAMSTASPTRTDPPARPTTSSLPSPAAVDPADTAPVAAPTASPVPSPFPPVAVSAAVAAPAPPPAAPVVTPAPPVTPVAARPAAVSPATPPVIAPPAGAPPTPRPPRPATRPPAKNPSSSAPSGGIVRDNPF